MDRWRGKVALVTGSSSGIGLAISKVLIREGMIVVGIARREEKMLNEMTDIQGSGKFYAKKCDISNETNVKEVFDYIKNTFKTLHVLVNNAGTKTINSCEDADTEELQNIINVNMMGVLYCYKHAVKLMKSHNQEACIININSITGHKVPNISWMNGSYKPLNVYPATKFALTALSETFINELHGHKVRVTNLSPGFVRTEMTYNHNQERENQAASIPALSPEDIAESVVYIIGTPAHIQITELTIKPLGERF